MFKKISAALIVLGLLGWSSLLFSQNANFLFKISGNDAKRIYRLLTANNIRTDAAMSHQYRQGKHVVCQYVDADMDDINGVPIAMDDSTRYSCEIKFNREGIQ